MFSGIKDFILKDVILEFKDLKCLQHLNKLYDNYLPWSGATIRPTALVYILNEIMINNSKVIVECGSGISTIYIAALLKQLNQKERKLYSIDHDGKWLSVLNNELIRKGLSDYVKLIHAPLTHCSECLNDNQTWYDTDVIRKNIEKEKIDLLIVDGPPANKKEIEYSRYPALPFFKSNFSNSISILLDDADRKGEQYIAKKWGSEIGETFKKSILKGNLLICKKGNSYNVM